MLGVGAVALLLPVLAGALLVPWSWDGLGYHLPIVHDALAEGTLRWVPSPGYFINCYPHLVDVFFVAFRLPFEDDTFVDLGQVLRELWQAEAAGGMQAAMTGLARSFLQQLTAVDSVYLDVQPVAEGARLKGRVTLRPR